MTADRCIDGHVQRLISSLAIGDRVDLEGDIFADPLGGNDDSEPDTEHPEFQFEFEVVDNIEVESDDCICVTFESGFACGFPPDHWVDVDGEQVGEAAQ